MPTTRNRNALLGRAHHLARALRLEGDSWRTMLMCLSGRRSCKDLDTDALQRLVRTLEKMAAGTDPDEPETPLMASCEAIPPAMRPTPRQWAMLNELALRMGWSGVRDERLRGFMARTTACTAPEALTRRQASACITGLLRWCEQVRGKQDTDTQRRMKE
ncbi:hypothetical protein DSF30_13725 [Salmonella enterica subsp. enterica serovar Oranienburg]|nr:hypothetical protein [Salmonella enterica subsp. enterica serovar Oranienburg]ECD5542852.1 DUF1018 domain-containing protein [Salmonella enterica subsp. enterica serovar Kokomlemle]HAF2283660.1 DUF1018 domain-containing protein [Salmonella enterica]EBX4923446.1 hypothetical protein [Salmonella enterica subsp. enterica serovar Oranienburg]EDT5580042.1 DUF1018 domain-containing protein [Salmonella enterica subsp. enterica serovar Kokomlemle]